MATIGPSPFTWLEFDETGTLVEAGATAALAQLIDDPAIADLVVLAHGWKNDRTDATKLYSTLWNNVCPALATRQPARIAVAGILWPAKAYTTDLDQAALAAASGAQTLGVSGRNRSRDLTPAEFEAALAEISDLFGPSADTTLALARDAAGRGINDSRARALFTSAAAMAGCNPAASDRELAAAATPFADSGNAQAILSGLSEPPKPHIADGMGTTQGLADGIGQVFQGANAAVVRFLNQLTYFEMKKRAGIVGGALGGMVLAGLQPKHPVRLHLIGHSFGARLVTAAASRLPRAGGLNFESLTLLQGAFSHNALAATVTPGVPGAFADVVGRPRGPISITHTHNDSATTFWYPLASRLARDVAAALGDAGDMFGAMGANGAQKLAADAVAPENAIEPFKPVAGKVNGFLADAYVVADGATDAHNNIANPTIGRLVASILDTAA